MTATAQRPSLYAPIDESDELYQHIRLLEKTELHSHLMGSISPECLERIARTQGKMTEYNNFINERERLAGRVHYEKCFSFFSPIEKIMGVDTPCKTEEQFQVVRNNIIEGVKSICKQYANDNVRYVELRTSLKRIREGEDFKPYLDAVIDGILEGEKENNIQMNLLLSLRRSTSMKDCEETLRLALNHKPPGIEQEGMDYTRCKVVGLDLSGSSVDGDGIHAIETLQQAKKAGFPIAIHIGESIQEKIDQQQMEMYGLNPQRVGHAVHLHDRKLLTEKQVIEFCPSSAYYTTMHQEEEGHPSFQDIKENRLPVVICCDDLAMAKNLTLSQEIYRVAKALGLTKERIAEMQEVAKKSRFDADSFRLFKV